MAALLAVTASSWAQMEALHATEPLPSFEVATIKPIEPNVTRLMSSPGMSATTTYSGDVRRLIAQAYGVEFYTGTPRVIGGPNWLDKKQYVIQTKISDDIFPQIQKMPPEDRARQHNLMTQSLLAERFKLKVHFERRTKDDED